MNAFLLDLRHAFGALRRAPGFALAALLTLAFGIGANSAMYSVVDRVLGPLPYPHQDRMVVVLRENPRTTPPQVPFSAPVYRDYAAGMGRAEAVTAFGFSNRTLSGDGETQKLTSARVNAGFFRLVGFQPILGRAFLPEEDAEHAAKVVLLDHRFWQRRFGGDPSIVGRSIRLDGRDVQVIGVMPAACDFFVQLAGMSFDLIEPMAFSAEDLAERYSRSYFLMARLKPGVSLAAATQEVRAIHAALNEREPGNPDVDYVPRVAPVKEALGGMLRPPLAALLALVGFVLLIACANLSNLLLARGFSRQRELTICSALGAGRWGLMSRLLAEGVVLGLLGGAAALAVAQVLLVVLSRQLDSVNIGFVSISASFGLSSRVVGLNFALAALSVLVFSLVPAWQSSRIQAGEALKEGAKGSGGPGQRRLRSALVVLEVAGAMVLLVGAGLMIRSLRATSRIDPGFDTRNFLAVSLTVPTPKFPTEEARVAVTRAILERAQAVPGVRLATHASAPPLQGNSSDTGYRVEGQDPPKGGYVNALYNNVAPGYFRTMGIPLRRGEDFQRLGAPVCIINETMARLRWPGQDPIGQRLHTGRSREPLTVVGVAANVQQVGLGSQERTQIYLPSLDPGGLSSSSLCLRTEGPPMAVLPALRRAVQAVDPDVALAETQTGEELIRSNLMLPAVLGALFSAFGLLGLLLAAFGLYGLMSFVVTQRTREVGIRMALGGCTRHVVWEIVKQGLLLVSFGLGIGVLASVAVGRLLASQFEGISAADPAVMATGALVLLAVGIGSTLLPASVAARVDPVVALRND